MMVLDPHTLDATHGCKTADILDSPWHSIDTRVANKETFLALGKCIDR